MCQKGPRAQIDRKLYRRSMQEILHSYASLHIRAGSVFDLVFDHSSISAGKWGKITGVRLGGMLVILTSTNYH